MRTYNLFMINNFSGGLNVKAAPMSVEDNQATGILNFEFDLTGALVKRNGRMLYNQTPVSGATAVDNLARFYRNDGSRALVASMKTPAAVKIYKGSDGAGAFTEITGGSALSAGLPVDMLTYRDTLFISNGAQPVQYFQSGTTKADISGSPAPPKGKYLAVCDNRLFVAGNPASPNTIYYSGIALFSSLPATQFPEDNFIAIPRQDTGDVITGLAVFRDELFVFRRNDIWALMGSGPENYVLQQVNNCIGALGHRAIANTGSSLIFASPGHIYEYSESGVKDIGLPLEPLVHSLDFSNAIARSYPAKNQVWICCGTTASKNDRALVYDRTHSAWSVFDIPLGAACVFDGAGDGGEIYGGAPDAGTVWKLDTGSNDAGQNIAFSYTTKHFSMGAAQKSKTIRRLFFNADTPVETGAFGVSASMDFGRMLINAPALSFAGFNRWGEFPYGQAVYGGGMLQSATVSLSPGIHGRYASLTLSGSDANPLKIFSVGIQNKIKPMRGE